MLKTKDLMPQRHVEISVKGSERKNDRISVGDTQDVTLTFKY